MGNCSKEQLNRLLRLRKRCARMILDAYFQDNSAMLYTKLGWLPIDNIIRTRKLSRLHKSVIGMVKNVFQHMLTISRVAMITTREPQEEMILSRLSARKNSGLRTFHSSATRLWHKTEPFLGTFKGKLL